MDMHVQIFYIFYLPADAWGTAKRNGGYEPDTRERSLIILQGLWYSISQ